MTVKSRKNDDPLPGTYWRHLPSSELYRVAMVAANPNTAERIVVYMQPAAPRVYFHRPITEFQKKFLREPTL